MPAKNSVEPESHVIEQAGRASLIGSSGDAGCLVGGSRAVMRDRRVAAHGPEYSQAGSCRDSILGSGTCEVVFPN